MARERRQLSAVRQVNATSVAMPPALKRSGNEGQVGGGRAIGSPSPSTDCSAYETSVFSVSPASPPVPRTRPPGRLTRLRNQGRNCSRLPICTQPLLASWYASCASSLRAKSIGMLAGRQLLALRACETELLSSAHALMLSSACGGFVMQLRPRESSQCRCCWCSLNRCCGCVNPDVGYSPFASCSARFCGPASP